MIQPSMRTTGRNIHINIMELNNIVFSVSEAAVLPDPGRQHDYDSISAESFQGLHGCPCRQSMLRQKNPRRLNATGIRPQDTKINPSVNRLR
jgi:hypothetical protein